jgi:hypothetical protein
VHPCPCGFYGDSAKACTPFEPRARQGEAACAPSTVTKYQKRISGPLLDRIDINVEVPRVDYQKLRSERLGESSECIRARVEAARQKQYKRFLDMKSNNVISSIGASCAGAVLLPARAALNVYFAKPLQQSPRRCAALYDAVRSSLISEFRLRIGE